MSRTSNSLKNIATTIGGQMLNNVLRLVCRTVFIHTLGKEYLGISSLYANILTLLSLSELGFGTAITYSLYKPLVEKDEATICALMNFFKKSYRIIGVAILLFGGCLIPFLPTLMNGTTDAVNIYLYYALYLVQTVVSYLFFAYKSVIIIADQKKYINDTITYIFQILMNTVQILILIFWKSFFLYTIVAIANSIIQNIVVAYIADRKYPFLKNSGRKLSKEEKKDVFERVYAMSLYRISTVVGTATDNLIISTNISVLFVGLYDNYYMIIQVIQKLIQGFFQSFTSSLGNYYVLKSKEENEFMFRCLNRLNSWMIVFCSVCFMALLQPFITFWAGTEYLLEYSVVVVVVMNFATNFMQSTVQIYKEASGLFVKGKYRAVMTAVLNLIISIILVKKMGLAGVFLGSIISRLVTTWWYDAWLLYRYGFEKSPWKYYINCIVTIGLIFTMTYAIEWICIPLNAGLIITIIIKGIVAVLLVNTVYLLLYGKNEECRYLYDKGKSIILKKIKK